MAVSDLPAIFCASIRIARAARAGVGFWLGVEFFTGSAFGIAVFSVFQHG
jgi:hypothetical protein